MRSRLRIASAAILSDRPHNAARRDPLFDGIGEAANRVSADTQAALPEIAWAEAVGLRNVLVHDYQRIDLARVWTIVENDLPPLVNALNAHLGEID